MKNTEEENVNGWTEWSKYVLKELERLNSQLEKMTNKMDNQNAFFHSEITRLKIQTAKYGAIWGFIAGTIPLILSIIFFILK